MRSRESISTGRSHSTWTASPDIDVSWNVPHFAIVRGMRQPSAPGAGIAIGVAIGIAMGAALHNIGLGIALGAAFGVVFEGASRRRGRDRRETGDAISRDD